MILSPLKPSFRRYIRLFWQGRNLSIFRGLEYEALERIPFSGRILDFGGGAQAHYYSRLTSWIKGGTYESANIDPTMKPTYLTDRNNKLPLEDRTFDMVLSLNTFCYVYDVEAALRELARVLKPGGRLVLGVPFLFRALEKDDYHRPTANWWEIALPNAGFGQIEIQPLAWDFLTAGLSITEGGGPLRTLRRLLVPLYGLVYAWIRQHGSGNRYTGIVADVVSNVALGYVITGVKKP